MLARRAHARRELALKLVRKGYARDEVEVVLDALLARGLLDDARTAGSLARSQAGRGRGRARIAADLAARGLARADVDTAIAGLDPAEERASLERALERKLRGLPTGLTTAERSKKLFDHLVRRGFGRQAVIEALRKKGAPADDDQD